MNLHTPRAELPDEAQPASASASTAHVSDKGVLAGASALIVGVGGLGSPAALALAAAGVARIGLADHDTVTLDNLARQILHRTEDLGRLKVDSGADSIFRLCPKVAVDKIPLKLTRKNTARIIAPYDVIIDGSDNLAFKLVLNDACALSGKPWVMGGVLRFFGQIMTILPGESACLRCLVGEEGAGVRGLDCGDAGVLGAVAGFVGMAQAADALRVIEGLAPAWSNRLMTADFWNNAFGGLAVEQDPDCPVCALAGRNRTRPPGTPEGQGALV